MTNTRLDDAPWYRHRMVWLVIAIPGLTVAGCMLTIYLAISNPETLVKDPALDSSPATRTPRDALP
ncbi:MAG: FixH family protein [Woeseia sp.]